VFSAGGLIIYSLIYSNQPTGNKTVIIPVHPATMVWWGGG